MLKLLLANSLSEIIFVELLLREGYCDYGLSVGNSQPTQLAVIVAYHLWLSVILIGQLFLRYTLRHLNSGNRS